MRSTCISFHLTKIAAVGIWTNADWMARVLFPFTIATVLARVNPSRCESIDIADDLARRHTSVAHERRLAFTLLFQSIALLRISTHAFIRPGITIRVDPSLVWSGTKERVQGNRGGILAQVPRRVLSTVLQRNWKHVNC